MNPYTALASFYRYFYSTAELPNNLCNYTWKLVFAIICLPFVWTQLLINILHKRIYESSKTEWNGKAYVKTTCFNVQYDTSVVLGLLYTILYLFLGLIVFSILEKIGFDLNVLLPKGMVITILSRFYLVGVLLFGLCIGLFFLIINIARLVTKLKGVPTAEELALKKAKIDAIFDKLIEREKYREQNPNIFKLIWRGIVAFKEKNCPIITWDYTKKYEQK